MVFFSFFFLASIRQKDNLVFVYIETIAVVINYIPPPPGSPVLRSTDDFRDDCRGGVADVYVCTHTLTL